LKKLPRLCVIQSLANHEKGLSHPGLILISTAGVMGADIITLRENEHIALTYLQSYTVRDKVSPKGRSMKQVIPYLTLAS
jgi:hypothetical protein